MIRFGTYSSGLKEPLLDEVQDSDPATGRGTFEGESMRFCVLRKWVIIRAFVANLLTQPLSVWPGLEAREQSWWWL